MSEDARDSFFPELDGDERRQADEWLLDYLRLILHILRERGQAAVSARYPHPRIDDSNGTGRICTPHDTGPRLTP